MAESAPFRRESKHKVMRQLSSLADAAEIMKQESVLFTKCAEEPEIVR